VGTPAYVQGSVYRTDPAAHATPAVCTAALLPSGEYGGTTCLGERRETVAELVLLQCDYEHQGIELS
jgi:hypothetical protein